jgi:hypothetical protein
MSGEFGGYRGGYFHNQIEYAAEDLADGRDDLTHEWAKFFEAFYPIAKAISWSEACDSGPAYPITETINRIGALKVILNDIEARVKVYKEVADDAIRNHVKKLATNP